MLLILCGVFYIAWSVIEGWVISNMDLGRGSPSTDAGSVIVGVTLYLLPVALPVLALGVLLSGPWKLPMWLSCAFGAAFVAFAGSFLWPVTTPVTGNIRITMLNEDRTPLADLHAQETWGVYGYDDKGGTDARITDAAGTVRFPPHVAQGSLGMRLVRNIQAYAFSEPTQAWGPMAGINISLPPGYWFPATSQTDETNYHHPSFPLPTQHPSSDSPLFYCHIYNNDPLHPVASIAGHPSGIANGEDIVVQLRPATADETRTIDKYNGRQTTSD